LSFVKKDILDKLCSQNAPFFRRDLNRALNLVLDSIISAIKDNKSSEIRGVGTWSPRIYKAGKISRNPRTGERIILDKDKRYVRFKASKELEVLINKKEIDD
jgi:nucleoid DNA-binding protein